MSRLTAEERRRLEESSFVFPEGKRYPVHDKAHGRAALSRVSQYGSPKEKRAVRKEVCSRYDFDSCNKHYENPLS